MVLNNDVRLEDRFSITVIVKDTIDDTRVQALDSRFCSRQQRLALDPRW